MTSRRRKTPLERVEDLAALIHGKASAVSLDKNNGGGWTARVWNEKGHLVEAAPGSVGAEALSKLLDVLARKDRGAR